MSTITLVLTTPVFTLAEFLGAVLALCVVAPFVIERVSRRC